jgi:hypothetical protein
MMIPRRFGMLAHIWPVSMAGTGCTVIYYFRTWNEAAHACGYDTGGRLLNNDTIVKIGLELVDACWNTYASTASVPLFDSMVAYV